MQLQGPFRMLMVLDKKGKFIFYNGHELVYPRDVYNLLQSMGAHSSAGQSNRLITERSQVQVLVGPPSCIARISIYDARSSRLMSESKFQSFLHLVALDQSIVTCEKKCERIRADLMAIEHEKQELFNRERVLKDQAHEMRKRVDSLELDMKMLDTHEARKKKQMDTVHSLKEYNSTKAELDLVHEEQQAKEQDVLAAWNKLEGAQSELHVYSGQLAEKIALCEQKIDRQQSELAKLAHQIEELIMQRPMKERMVPAEWLEKYTMMRARIADPVVPLIDNACSACFNHITMQDALSISRGALLQCKGCYRLLYAPAGGESDG
jgi:predicted  nucleic acid-binding Zn-ribbon protein